MFQTLSRLRLPVLTFAFATTWLAVGTARAALEQHRGSGSESCPSEPRALAMVLGDEQPQLFDKAHVVLALKREGSARWIAQISIKLTDGPHTQRTIALRGTCRDLVLASAVAIRLALDVSGRSKPLPLPAEVPLPTAAAAPPDNLARADTNDTAAALERAVPPPPPAPLPAQAVKPPPVDHLTAAQPAAAAREAKATAPLRAPAAWSAWEASAGGGLLVGAAPHHAPAVTLGLARVYANSSFGAEITYATAARASAGAGNVEAASALLAGLPCWHVRALALCTPVAAGVMAASAPGFASVRTRVAPLAMVGLRLEMNVLRVRAWRLRLHAAASAHLLRPRFYVDDMRLWTMPAGSLSVGIAIGRIFF